MSFYSRSLLLPLNTLKNHSVIIHLLFSLLEAYSEPCQMFKTELFG